MNVCVVGVGYVGLVTGACFAEMGNHVICVDVNQNVIERLKNKKVHIYEPGLEAIVERNVDAGRLKFTVSLKEGIRESLFIFICVGTPSNEDGSCNMEYVYKVARDIGRYMEDYKIVVNKSTVPVGTADDVRKIIEGELQKRGLDVEFDVVSNPEFLKEGDAVNDFMKPDRIIIGTDNVRTAELLKTLYAPFARTREKLMVMSIRSAEMTKYAANCMLASRISFINEIANICELVGADVNEVRLGIGSDPRIGYKFLYPGVGYGGSCFPKDVKALIYKAKECGYDPLLLEAVDNVNKNQKLILPKKIESFFDKYGGVEGKVLALWGLAFKSNTDDLREAPSLDLINYLTSKGMFIKAFDPIANSNARTILKNNSKVEILDDDYKCLQVADGLAVVTEWNQFRNPDFNKIKDLLKRPVIFDGRNLYDSKLLKELGFIYFGIGRS